MERLDQMVRAISHAAAIAGGGLIMLAALIICVDVFLRYFLSRSIGGADELSGYALGIAGAWGFSYALLSRSHIRIDTVYAHCPVRIRALLDLTGLAVFIVFMGYVTWRGTGVLSQSITSNTHSISALDTPLVVPQTAWVAGLFWFLAVAMILFVQSLAAFLGGNTDRLFHLIGSKAAIEEAEAEFRSAKEAHDRQEGGR